jgi:hypothetical protein
VAAGAAVYLFTRAEAEHTAHSPTTPRRGVRWMAAPVAGPHELGAILRAQY